MLDLTMISLCVGYGLFNAIRKTLPITLPLMMMDLGMFVTCSNRPLFLTPCYLKRLGLNKSEVGIIASNFAVAYGCSKFGGSVISDHVDCKLLFVAGLLCTSLTSLLFPFVGSSVTVLSLVWFVNGLVQVWLCVQLSSYQQVD